MQGSVSSQCSTITLRFSKFCYQEELNRVPRLSKAFVVSPQNQDAAESVGYTGADFG
jgi:hypothetical protein